MKFTQKFTKFLVLALALVVGTTVFASTRDEDFAGSAVIVRQILDKGLLHTHVHDNCMTAALDRESGTYIGNVQNCEPALGSLVCTVEVRGHHAPFTIEFSENHGQVTSAQVRH